MVVSHEVIGKPAPRVDGVEKVTGAATFAADQTQPGTLWGKTLHSPFPHARIVRIDTTAAKKLPGVYAVITGADVKAGIYGRAIKDIPVLADGRVRFVGERVAAVAADDKDIAQQALDLIEVEYEELPAVYDLFEAIEAGAPLLHPEFSTYTGGAPLDPPSNRYSHVSTDRGDIEKGFSEADLVVENTYTTKRVHQAYLEPQSVLVRIDGERVLVWTCSKAPYSTREALATAVDVVEELVIFHHSQIGGDFGGKATPADLPICYHLAKTTGRPVRMVLDYVEELMAGNPRHSTVIKLRTGVKKDGTLTAHHVQFFVNCGAYAGYKPGRVIGGANQAAGAYRMPNTRIESTHVYTNIVPGGHMRAPGLPQGVFALESHIDEVARAVGIDPLAFRLKNLISEEGEETAFGAPLSGVRVKETLAAAAEAAGYGTPKGANIGRGVAVNDHSPGAGQGTAAVTLKPDGSVTFSTPIFDQGTGTYTTFRQVVAEELAVAPERVAIAVWNTDSVAFDSGIGGSRGTRVATAVAHETVEEAKRLLLQMAADTLGWPLDKLVFRGQKIAWTDSEEEISWPDLVARSGADLVARAEITEKGAAPMTSFAAQVAEVAVDPETGEIRILNFTTAHDVGRILNPVNHQGQINGGFMQGLGFALMEELRIEEGHVTNLSFGDYKIPTIRDIPALKTVLLESEDGVGPYQIRGIGENSIGPVAPAIANAIEDAIGVRIRDLPITAEKVYAALKDKRE